MLSVVSGFVISLSHRNLVMSLSFCRTATWRNAFSMSETIQIIFVRNCINKPHKSSKRTGPRCH